MVKVLKLAGDCAIIPGIVAGIMYPFRHFCPVKDKESWIAKNGFPVSPNELKEAICPCCKTPINKKALFMYDLWKWQNDNH